MTRREIGDAGEQAVCDMLVRHGYEIVERNFTIRGGEIDIIAKKGEMLAFVEVKTRQDNSLTTGEEAITFTKKQRILKTANNYYLTHNCDSYTRFDVAVVVHNNEKIQRIKYYPAAFDNSK